jgi:UDP-N-acetylmuramyl pentapeptide phosphotransferase/UDP-N-acetylglucosamine-1-phosphate transferase
MSPLWVFVAGVFALLMGLVRSRQAIKRTDSTVTTNYAGRPAPVVLGEVVVKSANSSSVFAVGMALLAGPVRDWPLAFLVLGGTYLLYAVGLRDDRSDDETRGLAGHLKALGRGRVTTGVWKLFLGIVLSLVLGMQIDGGLPRMLLAIPIIALSVNVTNAMDVRPGRALKWAGLWLIPISFLALSDRLEAGVSLVYVAYAGAGLGVLSHDLGERGMLGDAGSNPVGLVLGVSIAAFLPIWALVVALVILAGLQLAAETVTISRLIDAVPPLRWFDRLGRRS